ncbi:MAG: hypothetical protein IKP40_08810 [Clostridia bacterium]|nr:hypothetical protein [Clostridia bacterium]
MRAEPLFRTHREQISAYCATHGLSYAKLKKCGITGLNQKNIFQYWNRNPDSTKTGLMDNRPAPIVLIVERTEDGLRFTETEHTHEFISE